MKKELRENLLRIKGKCHEKLTQILFSKEIHFKFKVHKKDSSQLRSTHSVCFQKSTGLKRISVPYQVRLNIARQNGYAKQNIILQHFLANKPRRELSGIWKKKKKLLHSGYYP